MNWFLLNMPLAAVFFGAWVGIPLWITVKHPDGQPDFSAAHRYLEAKAALAQGAHPELALAA
jgi:hypothetical protein